MKTVFRFGILVALVALVFASAPMTTRAQASCLPGLSADDCKLINDAQNAKLNTFVMDYSLALKTTGIPGGQDVDVSVKGNGPIDVTKLVGAKDPTAALKDLVMANTINFNAVASGQTTAGDLEIRIVGGTIYLNSKQFTGGKWFKMALDKALASSGSNPLAMMGAMGGGNAAVPPELAAAMAKIDLSKFIKTTKKDGADMDGQKTVVFTADIDLGAFLKFLFAKENRPLIKAILNASGSGTAVTDADLDQIAPMLTMLDPTLKATKISVAQTVSIGDRALRGIALNFSTTVDPQLMALAGGSASGATPKPLTVDFKFSITMSKLNAAVKVDAPADAVELPSN